MVAVEAAKKRQRARDVGLMERAFRQVTARQKSGRAAKAKYVYLRYLKLDFGTPAMQAG